MKLNKHNQGFPDDSIAITSYPRSGNTWMRLLLADIILQLHEVSTLTILPVHQDRIIPDIQAHDINNIWKCLQLENPLFKTHWSFQDILKKSVYIFRRPEDSLCSFYHFHLRYDNLKHNVSGGLDSFAISKMDDWSSNLTSFLEAYESSNVPIHFVSYERMHQNPVEVLQKVCEFLNLKPTLEMIQISVQNHEFTKHNTSEKLNQNNNKFFRKGQVLASLDEYEFSTVQKLRENLLPLYIEAKRIEQFQ
jgi:hypothetical protein